MTRVRKVDIVLCTFRRPGVSDTLRSIEALRGPPDVDLRVVVCDNDEQPSGETAVAATAVEMTVPVLYRHAPARNISIARNAGLAAASDRGAAFVAFLDDDEIAMPDWLSILLARADGQGADAVFGPSLADYGPDTPDWMRRQDHHSNRPERRGGIVQTGHTCNALLRWHGTPWQGERFDPARGRSGGEDTEFFFRLYRMGARLEIAEDALVRESVPMSRLSLGWIIRRKYRSGQSYAAVADGATARAGLAASAAAKVLVCGCAALAGVWSADRRNFWLLRGALHVGVIAGCLSLGQPEIYGRAAAD